MASTDVAEVVDCPACGAHRGLARQGGVFVGDDFIAKTAFACGSCGFTAQINLEALADARALGGVAGATQHLQQQVTAAYSTFRQRRKDAGLDA